MTFDMTCPLCCQQGFSSVESLCSALLSAATRKLSCPVCIETVVGLDKFTIHLLGHVASNATKLPTPPNVFYSPTILEGLGQISTPTATGSENTLAPNPVLYFASDSGNLYRFATHAVLERTNSVVWNAATLKIAPSTDCPPPEKIDVHSRKLLSTETVEGGQFSSCKELLTSGDFSVANEENYSSPSNDESLTGVVGQETSQVPPGSSYQNITCDVCDQSFSNIAILAVHKQLIHTAGAKKSDGQKAFEKLKKRPLVCKCCPSTFNLKSSLLAHIKVTHSGHVSVESQPRKESEKLACPICGKTCPKEGALHQHMKLAHGEKPWQCPVCSKMFTTKQFLMKHKRIHTGETPYECSICHKVFTFQQSYHKHMLYHTDTKPYCCSHCGRLFKELSTLNNHERIHSGEKPFTCENCGKAFRQRVSYLVHRRIHTGAMPYQCTACNKSFRYKISQRTHKCVAQPPGVVVKTQESLVARLQAAISKEEGKRQDVPFVGDSNTPKNVVTPSTSHPLHLYSVVSTDGLNTENGLPARIDISGMDGCDEGPGKYPDIDSIPSFAEISESPNSAFALPTRSESVKTADTQSSTIKAAQSAASSSSASIYGFTTSSNAPENFDSSPTECLDKLHISYPDFYEVPLTSHYILPQQNLTFDPMEDIDLSNFLLNFP